MSRTATSTLNDVVSKPAVFLHLKGRRLLSDLPGDVLLLVYVCMDFPSIIALRQTCRKLYHASKATSLWLTLYRYLTENTEDWRMTLAENPPPFSELEERVTRMVMFERNWSKGSKGVQRTTTFKAADGYVEGLLVPGGRWLLESINRGVRGVVYYDLSSQDIQYRLLIAQDQQEHLIRAMDFTAKDDDYGLTLNLAILSAVEDDPYEERPKTLETWIVSSDGVDRLRARKVYSIQTFRMSPISSISISGDLILRLSVSNSGPAFTIHRWKMSENNASDLILLPSQQNLPRRCLLLPDHRIASITQSSVEIYPVPDLPWDETEEIPQSLPRSEPQWVYEYTAPPRGCLLVTPRFHSQQGGWVRFSVRRGQTVFDVRVPLQTTREPEVTSTPLPQGEGFSDLGIGTSHAAMSFNGKAGSLITFDHRSGISFLKTFAGLTMSNKSLPFSETTFVQPFRTASAWWGIDEQSGRIVGLLDNDEYITYHFLD